MSALEKTREIARAYLVEAWSDYEAVAPLIVCEKYNLAVYHAQQAVEKLMKACFAAEGRIGIYKHEIFALFKDSFLEKIGPQQIEKIEDSIIELEEEWALSRYPDWDVKPIWIPSERYTIKDAEDNKAKMINVFDTLVKFLKDKYQLEKG